MILRGSFKFTIESIVNYKYNYKRILDYIKTLAAKNFRLKEFSLPKTLRLNQISANVNAIDVMTFHSTHDNR